MIKILPLTIDNTNKFSGKYIVQWTSLDKKESFTSNILWRYIRPKFSSKGLKGPKLGIVVALFDPKSNSIKYGYSQFNRKTEKIPLILDCGIDIAVCRALRGIENSRHPFDPPFDKLYFGPNKEPHMVPHDARKALKHLTEIAPAFFHPLVCGGFMWKIDYSKEQEVLRCSVCRKINHKSKSL
jgi:hypothetical protein